MEMAGSGMVTKGRGDKSVAFNVSIYGLWGQRERDVVLPACDTGYVLQFGEGANELRKRSVIRSVAKAGMRCKVQILEEQLLSLLLPIATMIRSFMAAQMARFDHTLDNIN
ncbi:unnamed protein product [Sphenostylis stenocarpa]|uniref:Uncharacterized protein n=1 Tax=Sphenostylis stenocarpa TaxID=92480 RepID=A0AA86SF53_9FABA|nr:unnamed protein product [Sphenostylis stenocarpa]